ncbi:MAG TPA: hypothetical protein VK689_04470, partial [Armatimonadota bacterium]|nr:hypothetical protein [Armatimonadota bacterium]
PYIQQFVDEWIDQYGYTGGSMPWLRMFYFYNPYAPRADYRALPKGHFGPGQGHMFFHDGWGANDSFFGAHMAPKQLFVDHQVWTMGNFQLYRKGEWAVTHPIDYGGVDRFGEGTNSMLLAGLSSVWERKDVVAQEFGEAGDYAYAAATNGGQQYEPPYPYQPTVFLHEWSRSLLYLPSRDKHSDTIVVFDRVNAQNPKNLPKLNLYRPNDQALINNAAALKQWVIHMPVPPTQTEEGLTWQTAGGQGVKVSTLLPVGQRRTLIDEDELWPEDYSHPIKEEQKWQVRITPPVEQQWDTFLNVVQAFDAGTPLSSTLVRSAGGEAEGTLLRRETDPDTLVLFGAKAAGRVLTSGYRVSWTAVTAGADLFLMDLDPSRSWSVSVDGGAPAAVKVSGQGVGRLFVRGAGSHTLALSATGGAPADTAAPAVPSGVSATPGNAQVTVAWNSNSEPDLAGYYVYRSTAAAGTYARQNSTAIPARTLAQGGLTNGSTYWYKVCAADTSGNESALSAPISATPKAADTATFSVNGTVTVDGAGMSGATVTGGGKSATTSATGAYTLAGLAAGTHTVGASKSGYTFSAAKPVTVGPD